jgi:hypothetical protein
MKISVFLGVWLAVLGFDLRINAQVFDWTTIAGLAGTPAYADGTNGTVFFNHPTGTAVDAAGNVYVADADNYVIRELLPSGGNWVSTTIAGLAGNIGFVDGSNSVARFSYLGALQIDSAGNVYVFDNGTVRKISPAGTNWIVTTVYNRNSGGWAVDASGNYYTASNYAIIQLAPGTNEVPSPTNYVETLLAGFPGISGMVDGTNDVARFSSPSVFAVDGEGTIYVTDDGELRKVYAAGVHWVASTLSANSYSSTVRDGVGNFYGVGYEAIYALPNGSSNWVSIGGSYWGGGSADGTNTSASFSSPQGLSINAAGNIFVADNGNSTIRIGTIVPTGSLQVSLQPAGAVLAGAQWQVDGGLWQTNNEIMTNLLVGSHTVSFSTNFGWTTPGNQTVVINSNQLTSVVGAYIEQYGLLQVTISPLNAANAGAEWQVDGGTWLMSGTTLTNVAAGSHTLSFSTVPGWVAATNLQVLVYNGQLTATNVAYTVAYNWNIIAGLANTPAYADGTNNAAFFNNPEGIAVDGSGNVFVADINNDVIRKISPVGSNWVTTTIAGLAGNSGIVDGTNNLARFGSIEALQIDGVGNLYVQDFGYYNGAGYATGIRKISPVGTNWVTTSIYRLAANNSGWAVDAVGNYYTASNYTVIQLSPVLTNGAATTNFAVTSLAGFPGLSGSADGTNIVARFSSPSVFAVDSSGTVYLTDNGKLRLIMSANGDWVVTTMNQTVYSWMSLDKSGNIFGSASSYNGYPSYSYSYNLEILWPDATNWAFFDTLSNSTTLAGSTVGADGTVYVADSGASVIRAGVSASVGLGSLQVTIQPTNAAGSSTEWRVDAGPWQTNGATVSNLMAGGNHVLSFSSEYGWASPVNQWVTISNGCTTMITANYVEQYGALHVDLTPSAAAAAGARWQVDGGAWQASGVTVSNLTVGAHIVAYMGIAGFITPIIQTNVTILPNQTTVLGGAYVALGAVQVNLTPPGAVSAGAQWQIDGGAWVGSGAVVSNLSLGDHTISFLPISGWITPGSLVVVVNSGETNTVSEDYVVLGSLQVTINPVGAVTGGAQWQVDNFGWQNSGNVVSNLATGTHTVSFSPATGFITPTNQTLNINPGGTTAMTASYIALGTVSVSLTPPSAVSAGAQWALDGGAWLSSGVPATNVSLGGHVLSFSPTTGFITPSNQAVSVASGINNFSANYVALGAVSVNIGPSNAINGGAQWALDGGAWENSGVTIANVALGNHIVSYFPAVGFITPSNTTVTVVSGQTTNINVTYVALGGVEVTLMPANAVSGGALWQFDGGAFQSSGTVLSNLTLGAHTIAFGQVNGWITPANQVVNVMSGETTNVTAIYVATGTVQVFITPIGAANAGASWQLDTNLWLASGNSVTGVVAGTHTVTFSNIAGWITPADQAVTVSLNQTTTATGVYVQQFGNLQVALTPVGAVSEGAQWQVDGGAWQASGVTLTNVTVGNHTVAFANISGWTAPASQIVSVVSNQTVHLTAIYQGIGSLQVMLLPTGAIVSGARWQVDGGSWMVNGEVVSGLSRGSHTVAYKPASGWVTPASQSISILANQTTTTNGLYTGLGYSFTTIAGQVGHAAFADGTNLAALFSTPVGICADASNNLYIADTGNSVIRKLTPTPNGWVSSTLAGSAGNPGNADGTNNQARFDYPSGVAVDSTGNLYVADQVNSTIRKLTTTDGTSWTVSTIAGQAGNYGSANGTNGAARFYYPAGVAVDAAGNVYVADQINSTIRKVMPSGANSWVVTTIAGTGGVNGNADGTNSTSRFYWPGDLTVDTGGNLFVADTFNDTIRKVSPVGTNYVTTTLCGVAGVNNSVDGTNSAALFDGPGGISLDALGDLFVADCYSSVIRKITPAGTNWVVDTIGGLANATGSNDGTNSMARFDTPFGVCVDANGVVYVADSDNQTIRAGSATSPAPANPNIAVAPAGIDISLNWQATPGLKYQVQTTTNLSTQAWQNVGLTTLATNSVVLFVGSSATNVQRFYRVMVTP